MRAAQRRGSEILLYKVTLKASHSVLQSTAERDEEHEDPSKIHCNPGESAEFKASLYTRSAGRKRKGRKSPYLSLRSTLALCLGISTSQVHSTSHFNSCTVPTLMPIFGKIHLNKSKQVLHHQLASTFVPRVQTTETMKQSQRHAYVTFLYVSLKSPI